MCTSLQCGTQNHELVSKPVPKEYWAFSFKLLNRYREALINNLCSYKWNPYFLNLFPLTEGSDRYYTPREEETNEIERQQAQVHDMHVRTRSDDSNRNEVISTQQMCKALIVCLLLMLCMGDSCPLLLACFQNVKSMFQLGGGDTGL